MITVELDDPGSDNVGPKLRHAAALNGPGSDNIGPKRQLALHR